MRFFYLVFCVFSTLARSLPSFELDPILLNQNLKKISQKPHPFGSPEQKNLAEWMSQQITKMGYKPQVQSFTQNIPELKKIYRGQNIMTLVSLNPHAKGIVILASHYDTKALPDYVGANDSASSSAFLLTALKNFQGIKDPHAKWDLLFVWFDGEEALLPEWYDFQKLGWKTQDNTYGSRFFVSQLKACNAFLCLPFSDQHPIHALFLSDMIGAPHARPIIEGHSSRDLMHHVKEVSLKEGIPDFFSSIRLFIEDDHVPFLHKAIPSINLIDFTHLDHWHKKSDTLENLSQDSIRRIGKIILKSAYTF